MQKNTTKQTLEKFQKSVTFDFDAEVKSIILKKPKRQILENLFRMICRYERNKFKPVLSGKEKIYLRGFISRTIGKIENDDYNIKRPTIILAYTVKFWDDFISYLKNQGVKELIPTEPQVFILLKFCAEAEEFTRAKISQKSNSISVFKTPEKCKINDITNNNGITKKMTENNLKHAPATYEELLVSNPELNNLK
jgi:hypothetical protein